jgi:hypothetical protein
VDARHLRKARLLFNPAFPYVRPEPVLATFISLVVYNMAPKRRFPPHPTAHREKVPRKWTLVRVVEWPVGPAGLARELSPAKTRIVIFSNVFPMFVPSLSWKNDYVFSSR